MVGGTPPHRPTNIPPKTTFSIELFPTFGVNPFTPPPVNCPSTPSAQRSLSPLFLLAAVSLALAPVGYAQTAPAPKDALVRSIKVKKEGTAVSEQFVLGFVALREGDSHNPLKTIVQPADQRSIAYSMVGRDAASETLGFKMVYEFDPRRTRNAYRFHSFIFLCDDVTGQPIALMDVVKLGPLRTSATSALMVICER